MNGMLGFIKIIILDFIKIFLFSFFLFSILEFIRPGFVLAFLNLEWFFLIALGLAFLYLFLFSNNYDRGRRD